MSDHANAASQTVAADDEQAHVQVAPTPVQVAPPLLDDTIDDDLDDMDFLLDEIENRIAPLA